MSPPPPESDLSAPASAAFRAALAELVAIGMSVARMVGRVADTETAVATAAASAGDEDAPWVAASLAEAIEADRAAAAAAEARRDVVARADVVASAFASVSRAVRRTVLLAERLDRDWARPADERTAMARRQIARGVADAVARDAAAHGRDAEAVAERLDALDTVEDIGDRPAEDIIREVCRDLGVDVARMRAGSPVEDGVARGTGGSVMARLARAGCVLGAGRDGDETPMRRPDG